MIKYFREDKELKIFTNDIVLSHFNHAENQGHCPHCDQPANDRFFYDPEKDSDSFEGYIERGRFPHLDRSKENDIIVIFKCKNCNEMFWLHSWAMLDTD